MSSGQIVFIGLGTLVGCAFGAFGLRELFWALRLLHGGVRTQALFVGWEKREGWEEGKRVTSHYPTFEFVDQGGKRQRVTLESGGGGYQKGSIVNIVYDPRQPSEPAAVRIASFEGIWLWCCIGLGVGFASLGLAFFIWYGNIPVKWG